MEATTVNVLIKAVENNVDHFDKTNKSKKLNTNLRLLKFSVEKCAQSVEEIRNFAPEYDFDEETSGNGYHSFVNIFDAAVKKTTKITKRLISNREKILFRADNYANDFEEWTEIFEVLSQICEALVEVHRSNDGSNLYNDCSTYDNIISKLNSVINPKPFYGKNIGFQFTPSMRPIIKFIVLSMASYYSFYFKTKPKALKVLRFPISFSKYQLHPKKRAAKYLHASENSTTEFCRSFWFLNEGKLMHTLPNMVGFQVEVNKLFKIQPEPLEIHSKKFDKMIDIPVPSSHIEVGPVSCRLLCAKKRNGMMGVKPKPSNAEPSKYFIFHVHGGGWAAQTSKSHELYLREWAVKLDVPILSVDYSLAPEAPFPRAIEEVFYAYCWALKNSELVGSTCENIVFVGDSAGGNLNTSCIVKCIEMGIPIPKGILNIYAPFSIGFTVAPARFMSLIDPVLPYGFTTRLFKSYGEKKIDENGNDDAPQGDTTAMKKSGKVKRKIIYESMEHEFDVKVHDSPLLSPYYASDKILGEFPPTRMLSTNLDPCLDDSIELGKKLKQLGVAVEVDVLQGLAHGFLYFTQISKECHDASMICVERIKTLLGLDHVSSN